MDKQTLNMPTPEANGWVKTMNNMGFMTPTLDVFSQAFVEFSLQAPGEVVDIGAAYGVATLAALERGATVIANDVDSRHLEILAERAGPHEDRLTVISGAFPNELDFMPGSVGAILICRVLHFFDGATIEQSIQKLSRWLAPGGKVFIVAETPFLKNFKTFIPVYESRIQSGATWPGFVEDVMAIDPVRGVALPKQMHLLDPTVLSQVLTKNGFVIEKAETFARPEFPLDLQLDGRESVGVIARKV